MHTSAKKHFLVTIYWRMFYSSKKWKNFISERVDPARIDLSSFEVKEELSPDVWQDDDFIKKDVKKNLKKIAEDFLDSLDVKNSLIDDIIITGMVLTDVTQTTAEIELKTKVKNKDHRVFLDGIYKYSQSKGIEK